MLYIVYVMPFQPALGSYTKLNGYSSICWHTWHHCIDFFKIISKDAFHTPIISLSSETLYRAFKVEYLLCGYCIFIFLVAMIKTWQKAYKERGLFWVKAILSGEELEAGPKEVEGDNCWLTLSPSSFSPGPQPVHGVTHSQGGGSH